MSFAKTLSRDEMKNIMVGGCQIYCCSGPGSCSTSVTFSSCDATTHQGCQSQALDAGFTCQNDDQYIAALST